ncbi:NTP transferase domain-containing protein [Candidatus Bathyarchaeota archaeon]|nr:NTP transferase domain-containing protein [Candidatus Bathyarchaeota archaeon]
MVVTALLMTGGEGSRLKTEGEKPLLKIGGKTMIEYVLEALKGAKKVDDIIVTASKHTPKTAAFARKRRLNVLQTPGKGFCLDARYAIKKLRLETVLTICADLPLITSEFIDKVITHYEQSKKPALTVMAPLEIYKKFGLSADYVFEVEGKSLVPVGVNVVDGTRIKEKELDEEILVVDDERIIVNVNTSEDLNVVKLVLKPKLKST